MKSQIVQLKNSFGSSQIAAPSEIPQFTRRLALRLTRIDVVAMEIRALEQRHRIRLDTSGTDAYHICAYFSKETDVPSVIVTFIVSSEYPVAPPAVKIESFDKNLDLEPMQRLGKHIKAGNGGIVRTCDTMKAFWGTS